VAGAALVALLLCGHAVPSANAFAPEAAATLAARISHALPLAAHWEPAWDAAAAAAALALARASASQRPAAEQAVLAGDGAALAALRRERLAAALGVARALAVQAWEQAGAPALVTPPVPGAARVWPNPARGGATLLFDLPLRGSLELEL